MLRFEWDPAKARNNFQKHGVRFEQAMHVFDDRYALFVQDRRERGEPRWQAIGFAGGVILPLVVHTIREEGNDEVIRLISARQATERNNKIMPKLVRKTLADNPLTPSSRRKLAKLAERPDSEIGLSEIPELNEEFWSNAVRNPFYRPLKQQITVRLDADVIAWLRRQGNGYQTRMNRVLREAMFEDLRSRKAG